MEEREREREEGRIMRKLWETKIKKRCKKRANNKEKVWEQFPDTLLGKRFFQFFRILERSLVPNLGKITFSKSHFPIPQSTKSRIEKSNPMNICWEKLHLRNIFKEHWHLYAFYWKSVFVRREACFFIIMAPFFLCLWSPTSGAAHTKLVPRPCGNPHGGFPMRNPSMGIPYVGSVWGASSRGGAGNAQLLFSTKKLRICSGYTLGWQAANFIFK